jgi:hypothetical protein
MSGSRRTIIDRRRRPLISPETVQLFAELENTPARKRRAKEFVDRDYDLHRQLGLGTERFCSQVSVLDRAREPCRPPEYQASKDFWVAREMRLRLLAAVELGSSGGSAP